MDISQAKEEIRRAVRAYTERDETGQLCIPAVSQRPLFLLGPPGIGKTAILSQLAQELGVSLVCYTMTHHTRQSALGLPLIREKQYGGRIVSATEYTMSEILAAVYDCMEQSGQQTGILFLDEINCVSETLTPAILQLLQSKQFGTHRLPEGWVIVAAGNPPQYNQSARLFDTATMDRVRLLEIAQSYPVWRRYALARGLHPAIVSYLELQPEHFFTVQAHAHGRSFVTARSWEDLSRTLFSYERLSFPVEESLFGEFLQHEEIAASFTAFYRLYRASLGTLPLPQILTGEAGGCAEPLRALRFDGRLATVQFLLHALGRELSAWRSRKALQQSLDSFLSALDRAAQPLQSARENLARRERAMEIRKACGALSPEEAAAEHRFCALVHPLLDGAESLAPLQQALRGQNAQQTADAAALRTHLKNALSFVRSTFGPGQELTVFLTELEALPGAGVFLKELALYTQLRSELGF